MLLTQLFQNPIYFVAVVVGLVVGITIHEFSHAWVAYRCGDATAKLEGRVTLNPLAHLDPIGTLFLFVAGFGWGKPVPINPRNFNHRNDELKVAFAGIIANICLAFALAIPIRVALYQGQIIDHSMVLQFLNIMIEINLILATFNLLPIPPLDGSHLIEYFLSEESRYKFQAYGIYILLGVILLERVTDTSILLNLMEPVMRLLSFLVKGTPISPF
ncbi:MAG: site-2 protease family protein [bacterium]